MRVRFDDVVIDRGAMLVTKNGQRLVLEPKALDVLLHLTARHGQLVTKTELIATVWQGVAVTDHVLTRVIGQLRRALGDAAREARYIETVPTRGYRFIGAIGRDDAPRRHLDDRVVTDVPLAAPPLPPPPPEVRGAALRGGLSWPRMFVTLVLAMSVAGVGGWLWARTTASPAEWEELPAGARQLTFAPALDVYPDFSPDGRLLAYASSASGAFEIEVRSLTPDARPQRVTADGRGNVQPDWSPDQQYLAYHSLVAGGVWVVPALGGVPRRLVASGASPAWSPDGRRLVFQSGEPATVEAGGTPPPSRLWTVDLTGGTPRPLTYAGRPIGAHTEPAWSPDGRRVTFIVRGIVRAEIWSVAAEGGAPQLVWSCSGACSRAAYEPSGKALIVSVRGQGYLRLPIDPVSGQRAGPPAVLVSQRSEFPGHIAVSPDGKSAVFTEMMVRSNLYSLGIDARGLASGAPRAVTNTTGRAMLPMFSPDGRRIAFSARREVTQICLVPAGGGEVTPLPVPPGFANIFRPVWVSGGIRIMSVANDETGAALVSIDPDSRETRVLARLGSTDVSGNAQFLAGNFFPDGRRVVFARETGDRVSLWAMDLETSTTVRLTPDDEDATFPTPSPDGQWIAYERVEAGSMQPVVMRADGADRRPLMSGRGLTWPHSWSADSTRIFVAMRRGATWSIGYVARTSGAMTTLITEPMPHAYLRYPSVSPSGDQVVYERTETTGNIWRVSLWGESAAGTR